jgi:MEMO1 family protein
VQKSSQKTGNYFCSQSSIIPHMPPDEQKRLLALVRESVRCATLHTPPPPVARRSPAQGVFVTIERRGQVVGCRGTLTPRFASLEQELVTAACSAAAHDPRYRPLQPTELTDFQVTITLIQRLEPLPPEALATLLPDEGLVLSSGTKTGVVLPWEGRDPQTRLEWAYKKAGVARGSAVRLQKMQATRFRG